MLFAFSLRTAVASLSPVFSYIQEDFAVPAAVAGLIAAAPPFCFAIFGLLTPLLERRFGLDRLAAFAMGVAAAAMTWRAFAGDAATLLASTALIFAAVGMGNVLLPPLARKYFPDRIGLVTTIYSTALAVSTFIPPLVAVPIAESLGWRVSLGLWAVFAAFALIPWIVLLVRERAAPPDDDDDVSDPRVFGRLWSLPVAWALTGLFASSGIVAYVCFAWLPALLIDTAGVNSAEAGAMLSLFSAMGLPASLIVPVLVARWNAVRLLTVVGVAAGLAGIAGLLVAPAAAPWLWAALLGTAPLFFPLTLVLLGLRARTHEGAVALSGFVQSIGYAVTAVFPLAVGVLNAASGDWTATLWILAGVIVVGLPAGFIAARRHTVEDEWERRHGPWS